MLTSWDFNPTTKTTSIESIWLFLASLYHCAIETKWNIFSLIFFLGKTELTFYYRKKEGGTKKAKRSRGQQWHDLAPMEAEFLACVFFLLSVHVQMKSSDGNKAYRSVHKFMLMHCHFHQRVQHMKICFVVSLEHNDVRDLF